uniref:Small ribosomal subunit protein uS8c n=1 Tax=Halimeda cryptica TaxID=170409 RepID=C0KS32_9CHLO|nr:ribosomal protein S8 [Halimeda cryptica]
MNNSISNLFTRLRNANLVGHNTVRVPMTLSLKNILEILARHGFIKNFYQINNQEFLVSLKVKSVLRELKTLSRPGCRLYVSAQNIPKIRGQIGVIILSTSQGILSDREARRLKIGGEILGYLA